MGLLFRDHLDDHTVMLETHNAAYVAETPTSVKDSKKAATASKLEVRDIKPVNRQSIKRSQKKGGKKDVFTSSVDEHPTLLDPLSTLPCNAYPGDDAPVAISLASRVSTQVRKVNRRYAEVIEGK